jgi:hypothetical protein
MMDEAKGDCDLFFLHDLERLKLHELLQEFAVNDKGQDAESVNDIDKRQTLIEVLTEVRSLRASIENKEALIGTLGDEVKDGKVFIEELEEEVADLVSQVDTQENVSNIWQSLVFDLQVASILARSPVE